MSGRRRLLVALTALATGGLWVTAAPPAAAQSAWVNPNTGNWNDPANWSGGVPASGSATQLLFNAAGTESYTATNNLADPFVLNWLAVNNTGTGTITIAPAAGGGTLQFAGSAPQLVNAGSGAATLSTGFVLGADLLLTGGGTGTVTASGGVFDGGGGFGLLSTGSGTFAFTASSSIAFLRITSGAVQVAGGTWNLTSTSTADATAAFVAGTASGQAGSFTLSGGAKLSTPGNVFFGQASSSTGSGLVTGSGTVLTATGATTGLLAVGNFGTGSLTISGAAVVNSASGSVARKDGSGGTVLVDGAGSKWAVTNALIVGERGTGSLTVQNGGAVSVGTGGVTLGGALGASGSLTVTGAGSQLVTTGAGSVGVQLGAGLTVSAGGLVDTYDVTVGVSGGPSQTTVVNAGTLAVRDSFFVGHGGTGSLTVQNGGVVTVAGTASFAGTTSTSVGTVTVTGANSKLTMQAATGFLVFGGGSGAGRGDLTVSNGGLVGATTQLTLAQDNGSTSVSTVDAGALTVTGTLSVGQAGTGGLTVKNGGTASAANVSFASAATGNGTVTVTGAGSALTATGQFRLAGSSSTAGGTAALTVAAGGSATAAGLLILHGGGTVNVNAAALAVGGVKDGNATSVGKVVLSNGGTVTVSDGLGARFSGVISGAGSVTKTGSGTQTLAGASTYTGGTTVNGGTLLATNTTGSATGSGLVTVNAGGTLGGTGFVVPQGVSGPLPVRLNGGTVQAGGTDTAAPTATNVLTLLQGLTFDGSASLRSTAGLSGGTPSAGRVKASAAPFGGGSPFDRDTGGAATDKLTIRLTNDGTLDLSGTTTYTVTVLSYDVLGGGLTAFTNDPNPTYFAVAAENFAFASPPLVSLNGGALSVSFAPVPEPAAVLALAGLGLGVAGAVGRLRRFPDRTGSVRSGAGPAYDGREVPNRLRSSAS